MRRSQRVDSQSVIATLNMLKNGADLQGQSGRYTGKIRPSWSLFGLIESLPSGISV